MLTQINVSYMFNHALFERKYKYNYFLTKLDRNVLLRILYNPIFLGVNPVFSPVTLTPY